MFLDSTSKWWGNYHASHPFAVRLLRCRWRFRLMISSALLLRWFAGMGRVIFPSFTSIGNNQGTLKTFLFVTGTGTGVGKTLLTGLLFFHLRSEGKKVIALKPFCCGGEEDLKFLGQ